MSEEANVQEHKLAVGDTELVIDTKGAWATSLRDGDGDVLFPRTTLEDGSGETKLRGGCHVCVPQFGPARDELGLAQHGFGRDSLWTLQDSTASTLVFNLSPTHEDYHDLQIVLTYTLGERSLAMELSLHNDGMSELRVAPAFHPYFATNRTATICLDDETLAVEDYQDTKFSKGSRKALEINKRTMTLSSDELNTWAIWSDRLGEYFCVEPTLGGNRFLIETPEEDELLPSNDHASYSFTISW